MKTYFFLYLVFSFVFFSFNQEDYKLVSVEFFKYGKRLEKVQYYYLRKDTAVLLPYNSDKIKIDKKLLNTPYFIIVAVYKQTIISFRIETNSFDYIKINAYRKGSFKTIYDINQGLEYDEIVTPTNKKFIFKDK